jgi:hypothetical protein
MLPQKLKNAFSTWFQRFPAGVEIRVLRQIQGNLISIKAKFTAKYGQCDKNFNAL